MIADDQTTHPHDRGDDAAAYVLGALDASELQEFRAHLETCVACREAVSALQRTADVLPLAAPQLPAPKSLRRRVLRSIRTDPASSAAAERPRLRSGFARSSFLRRPGLALGGAVAAAVIAFGAVEIFSGSSSPSTRVIQASVIGSPGHAQLRVAGGEARLVVQRLNPPPAGQIYEVWLKRPGGPPMPTHALFGVTSNGDGDVDVPGSLSGVQQVLVTREPAGGSLRPTHSPVIVAQLS
jgi:anti-sigma factor RsiW